MTDRRIPKVWNEAGLKCITISLAPVSILETKGKLTGRSECFPTVVHS